MKPPLRQCAALPFRLFNGHAEVMLITSRDTGRWIIPKGWRERNMKDDALAALEAFEEAGLYGFIAPKRIGRYRYDKILPTGTSMPCVVDVYLLKVTEEAETWPEMDQRIRRWMSPTTAASLVSDQGLQKLILKAGLRYQSFLAKDD